MGVFVILDSLAKQQAVGEAPTNNTSSNKIIQQRKN